MALVVAGVAHAETWYLMAADEKDLSAPQAASVMSKGSTIGPVHFAARAILTAAVNASPTAASSFMTGASKA